MTDRPDDRPDDGPARWRRDFNAASDRFDKALGAAAQLTTEAEHMAAIDAAIEDYNRAVDAYNAHVDLYNANLGLTEDDGADRDGLEPLGRLGHLVRNGDTATLAPAADADVATAVPALLADLGQRARDEKTAG